MLDRCRIVERRIDRRYPSRGGRVDVVGQILTGVADDAQPISRRIKIHAEEGAIQARQSVATPGWLPPYTCQSCKSRRRCQRHRASRPGPGNRCPRGRCQAIAIIHTPDLLQTIGITLPKLHQPLIHGKAEDGQSGPSPRSERLPHDDVAIAGVVVSTARTAATLRTQCLTLMVKPPFKVVISNLLHVLWLL